MDTYILISVFLCWLFLFLGFIHIYKFRKEKAILHSHINEVASTNSVLNVKKKLTVTEKVLVRLGKYADDFSALGERINFFSETSDMEVLLKKAGRPLDLTVTRLQGFKIVFTLLGFLTGCVFVILGIPLSNIVFVTFPFFGFALPILYIRTKAKSRQEALRRDLPDFLDTVSISLQAGAGLDNAIRETIHHYSGPLQEEFSRLIYEIELGVPREKAYLDMLNRNDNSDFQNFIKSLIQGTRLGVPVATTFQMQAEDIRRISIEQVKEKAAKASPKVTLITSLIIAPLIMMMILGLVILNMIYGENNIFMFF